MMSFGMIRNKRVKTAFDSKLLFRDFDWAPISSKKTTTSSDNNDERITGISFGYYDYHVHMRYLYLRKVLLNLFSR